MDDCSEPALVSWLRENPGSTVSEIREGIDARDAAALYEECLEAERAGLIVHERDDVESRLRWSVV